MLPGHTSAEVCDPTVDRPRTDPRGEGRGRMWRAWRARLWHLCWWARSARPVRFRGPWCFLTSCRAGVRSKLAVSLPQGCSAAAAVHGFVQCRSALQSAHRAEMDVGDTSPLVIPMPTSSRLVGAFGVTLRARDARAAVDAAFAPTAQASTPSSRCRTHLAAAGCGHASAVYGWARTTRTSRPPAEPPPRAVTCVRSSARS